MTAKEKHLAAVRRLEEPPPMSGCLAGAGGRTRLACWRGRPGWRGRTRPRRTACTAAGRRGRRRARRPGCLAALLGERRLLGHANRGGGYTRLCHAMDHGAALPRQDRWRGRALPRHRSALLVSATSALCRAAMHGVAQAFGRARAIGAAKNVSFLKKTENIRFKISFKKVLKLKKKSPVFPCIIARVPNDC